MAGDGFGCSACRQRSLTLLGVFLSAVMWVLVGVAPSAAQPSPPPVFSEVVDVRVVNVEVVVTDRQGNRVTGLGPDDFELLVDGEVVGVEYFSEIADGLVRTGGETGGDVAGVPSLEAGTPVKTNFLVFVDEVFSFKYDRERVIDRLLEQLGALGPEDRMAVVRYDGDDLEMVTTWTRDRAELTQALNATRGKPTLGLRRFAQLGPTRTGLDANDFSNSVNDLDSRLTLEERYYVDRVTEQVERVVRAAVSTLRSFAAPPGRKVMLLLSGGWPYDPAEYVVDDPRRPILESQLLRGERLFDPLRDTANLLGYTLYPVDLPGLQARTIGADRDLAESITENLTARSFVRESGIHQSLQFLADETGGQALLNQGRDVVLERVLADTRSYYWLGFTPERSGADERHEVEVRVKREDLRVRSRGDYFDFSRQSEVTLAVESALYFGSPPSANPLTVRLGKAKRAGLRTMTVPLLVAIPVDGITFLPGPEGLVAQLELRVAVLDEDGATTDTPVIPLQFTVEESPPEGTMIGYETSIKLRRKPHDLVVALYDVPTGTILSNAVEVNP